jgi:hypothetical protein
MPHLSLSRLLAAALAVAALAAPSALAQPAPYAAHHAGLPQAHPAAAAQDRRSPDAKDRADRPSDLRSAAQATKGPKPAGPPTWPVNPRPITAGQPASDTGNGGSSLPLVLVIIGGAAAALLAGVRLVRPRLHASRVRA